MANIQRFLEANLDGTEERYARMSANGIFAGSLFNIMVTSLSKPIFRSEKQQILV
jgi:hypothetical protein